MAVINFESYGETYELSFKISSYETYGNLAIIVMSKDKDGFIEPYAHLTTNICPLEKDNLACIDTNNFPEAIDIIEKYKLGTFTGMRIPSGYCEYPVYEMDMNELNKYKY